MFCCVGTFIFSRNKSRVVVFVVVGEIDGNSNIRGAFVVVVDPSSWHLKIENMGDIDSLVGLVLMVINRIIKISVTALHRSSSSLVVRN